MKFIMTAVLAIFASSAFGWQYATPIASPITNTTPVALTAAATNARNYLTGIQIINTSASVGSVVTVKDGTTVVWTGFVPLSSATSPMVPVIVNFETPIKGSANTALNFVVNTTGANVFVSAQGYKGL